MSRMSWRAVPGPERLVLLSAPGRDAVLATAAVLLTAIAKVFNILGLVYVTLPARIAVAAAVTVVAAVIALFVGQIQRHAEGRQVERHGNAQHHVPGPVG